MTTLTPEQLRTLFLFERLEPAQLEWLSSKGVVEEFAAGSAVYTEGEPATCFFVLLSGTISMSRRIHGDDVEVTRTGERGVYSGSMQAYLGERVPQVYANSVRAVSDVEMFTLPAEDFATLMREWFPMAMHLLEGLFFGMRNSQTIIGERQRLVALGALSAGLTHELNNPAAAAVRATATLRERVTGMRSKLAMIADGRLDGARLKALVGLQEDAVKRAASAPKLTPLQTSDAEDAVADWLDDHDIVGTDTAATLVAGGVDVEWLDQIAGAVGPDNLEPAVRWLTYTVDTELLMSEIEDAVTRISGLVAAAKQYSQLDRAPHQTVDVHELLDATLIMLNGKIPKGIRVEKEYDRTIAKVPAYAAELNQVWTNVIDNAVAAMGESGTLTIRTGLADPEHLFVEVADTGTGIPDEIRPRIFEPFFTTKPVGEGTGLGLDISYRIVVEKHRGDIRVQSRPGDTRFRVLLPLREEPVTR
jgi:signal transduction histidine kinase